MYDPVELWKSVRFAPRVLASVFRGLLVSRVHHEMFDFDFGWLKLQTEALHRCEN